MNPRVIIQAAGNCSRWKSDLPKHLVPLENTTLLQNTITKVLQYTNDIIIIGKDERYKLPYTKLHIPQTQRPEWYDLTNLKMTVPLWSDYHTIILAGDAYYTQDAINTIFKPTNTWRWTLRATPSSHTGKPHKETFALSIHPNNYQLIEHKIQKLIILRSTYLSNWRLLSELIKLTQKQTYDLLHGVSNPTDIKTIVNHQNVAHIDDMTDDFDSIHEYYQWLKRQVNYHATCDTLNEASQTSHNPN